MMKVGGGRKLSNQAVGESLVTANWTKPFANPLLQLKAFSCLSQ
jgi:hypothetical protein